MKYSWDTMAARSTTKKATPVDTEKKPRVQLASVLNINITSARCTSHLKQHLSDPQVEAEVKDLRKEKKEAETSGDQKTLEDLKKRIADLTKSQVRMSGETPVATAVIWDNMVKELLRYGIDNALAHDDKIVETSHFHLNETTSANLVYYPLYEKCKVWKDFDQKFEDELKKKRAEDNKAAKELRDAKKTGDVAEEAVFDDDEEHHTKTTFSTYVENALKTVKLEEKYANIRVSRRVREYLSDLISQGIARQASMARILVQTINVRTMNSSHIKAVVRFMMNDCGRTKEQVDEVINLIDKCLNVYREYEKDDDAPEDDAQKTDVPSQKADEKPKEKAKEPKKRPAKIDAKK